MFNAQAGGDGHHKTQCAPRTGARIQAPIPANPRPTGREKHRGWLTAPPMSRDVLTGYA
jgi:hypothetical protein